MSASLFKDARRISNAAPSHGPLSRSLKSFIVDKIRTSGPITVHEYMQLAAGSQAGYYAQRQQTGKIFGSEGDFITSPELSQVFGELVGVWVFAELGFTGYKDEWQLVELGPGTGTLMNDILGALNQFKESKASVHLVEISDALIDQQERLLCENPSSSVSDEAYVRKNTTRTGLPIYWYRDLDDVPAGFSVYVANEFLDALPIHQFQREPSSGGWREVYVALKSTSDDELCFMLSKSENLHTKGLIPDYVRDDNARTQWELSPKSGASVTRIMERFTAHGGFCLLIDYGHDGSRITPSLRAYRKHEVVDPLESPGETDITADVDFGYLRHILQDECLVFGPVEQRHFLAETGIHARMSVLMRACKSEEQRKQLFDAYKMLVGDDKHEMGTAFKAFSLFPKTLSGVLEHRGGVPHGFSSTVRKEKGE